MKMKNNYLVFLLLAVVAFLGSCQKDKTESPVGTTNTKPAYFPPQQGYIKLDISSLTLNKGGYKLISAVLHNSDNSVSINQPSFLWQSSNSNIATVSNGQITAVDTGYTSITVTDGLHGVLTLNLKVVSTSINISKAPTQIVFNTVAGIMGNNAIALLPNTTRNISYTIYDAQGNTVNTTPVFYSTTNVPFSINDNSITSSSTLGIWDIKAKIGSNVLSGNLKVIVFQSDTTTFIEPVFETFPSHFYKPNLVTDKPLLVHYNQVWYSLIDGIHWNVKTVSPEQIISNFPNVVDVNAAGYLSSSPIL